MKITKRPNMNQIHKLRASGSLGLPWTACGLPPLSAWGGLPPGASFPLGETPGCAWHDVWCGRRVRCRCRQADSRKAVASHRQSKYKEGLGGFAALPLGGPASNLRVSNGSNSNNHSHFNSSTQPVISHETPPLPQHSRHSALPCRTNAGCYTLCGFGKQSDGYAQSSPE